MHRMLFALIPALALSMGVARAQQAAGEPYLFTPTGCFAGSPFSDVPQADPSCPWIKQFAADGISAGCGSGKFCPDQPVTRKQMAMLMEKAMRGTDSWEPWRGAYRRTLIVNPKPGWNDVNGARLQAALAEITDASYGNPYLIKIEPGWYDLGNQALDLKPFVDIEGSGVGSTFITGSRNGALVFGADDAELRSLTVWNATVNNPVGIAMAGDTLRLTDVDVITSGELSSVGIQEAGNGAVLTRVSTRNVAWQPSSNAYGVTIGGAAVLRDCTLFVQAQSGTARGVVAFSGAPQFQRVRIEVDGGIAQYGMRVDTGADATLSRVDVVTSYGAATGIALFDGSATIVDSRIDTEGFGTTGIACSAASSHVVSIRNSQVSGNDAVNGDPQCSFGIANSQLTGDIDSNGSPMNCYGVYDYQYNEKSCS